MPNTQTAPNQVMLNNTNNDVTITVTAADNYMAIYLNPDEGPGSLGATYGFVQVYESLQKNMGAGLNVTINIADFLAGFHNLNPKVKSIELVFCMENFGGPGPYAYKIAYTGGTPKVASGSLASWTSQMDSYVVNIF